MIEPNHSADDNVRSFCVLFAGNTPASYLRTGNFAWLRIADECNVPEGAFLVFNVVWESACHIAKKCQLQQFIYGYRKDGETTIQYYQVNSMHPKRYDCVGTKTFLESQPDADCLTMVVDGLPFTVPYEVFKLLCAQFNAIINNQKDTRQRYREHFERCLKESLNSEKTAKWRYENRALIYGGVF